MVLTLMLCISSLETLVACLTCKMGENTYVHRITDMILSLNHKEILPILASELYSFCRDTETEYFACRCIY